jgi:hypothetical protein
MAKNQGSNKPTTTAPAAAAPAPEGQDTVKDLAISFPGESVEGIKQVVTLLKEAYPNEDIDARLADFFKADPAANTLTVTLPDDLNEAVDVVLGQLKAAFNEPDVDVVLADRFKTDVPDTHTPRDLVAVTGFELTFPLDALADNITEGLSAVQKALNEQRAPEGVVFPQALVGFQFPLAVLERYIQGTLLKERRLEDAELVFADPALDSHLKTLNFSRYLQGLEDTYFYLRFL